MQLAEGGRIGRGGRYEQEHPPPQLRLEDAWLGLGWGLGLRFGVRVRLGVGLRVRVRVRVRLWLGVRW